jgi:hypothetical protein
MTISQEIVERQGIGSITDILDQINPADIMNAQPPDNQPQTVVYAITLSDPDLLRRSDLADIDADLRSVRNYMSSVIATVREGDGFDQGFEYSAVPDDIKIAKGMRQAIDQELILKANPEPHFDESLRIESHPQGQPDVVDRIIEYQRTGVNPVITRDGKRRFEWVVRNVLSGRQEPSQLVLKEVPPRPSTLIVDIPPRAADRGSIRL